MGIKDTYYYVFYKIYKLLEQFARPNWLIKSRGKATNGRKINLPTVRGFTRPLPQAFFAAARLMPYGPRLGSQNAMPVNANGCQK